MRVMLSHQTKLASLACLLERAVCRVSPVGARTLFVSLPQAETGESAGAQVDAYLAVWQRGQARRGARIRVERGV